MKILIADKNISKKEKAKRYVLLSVVKGLILEGLRKNPQHSKILFCSLSKLKAR